MKSSFGLFTDLYELTMAYGYWNLGMAEQEAVFHLAFRKHPFKGAYTIAAGLETLIGYIENFCFSLEDLDYLSSLSFGGHKLEKGFLEYLKNFHFSCDIDAVPEGELVFPNQPLVRVKGPLLQAQLLESLVLNIINFQSLIATKASRVVFAAGGDPVVEFGMRRAQGFDGAMSASRAAYIGGCESTSNTLAGKCYGIPVKGTMAHSWIMAFKNERDSFVGYGEVYPDNLFYLIDTYDTPQGCLQAIEAAKKIKKPIRGVRLDSGDLNVLSRIVRKELDDAGFFDAKIMASNELDDVIIADLKAKKAPIDIWGVGTHLVTAKDQPALDGVYKLSAICEKEGWRDVLKFSEKMSKTSSPGILQTRRYFSSEGNVADMVYDEKEKHHEKTIITAEGKEIKVDDRLQHRDLLVKVFEKGKRIYESPSLHEIRKKVISRWAFYPEGMRKLQNPVFYPFGFEKKLTDKIKRMMKL